MKICIYLLWPSISICYPQYNILYVIVLTRFKRKTQLSTLVCRYLDQNGPITLHYHNHEDFMIEQYKMYTILIIVIASLECWDEPLLLLLLYVILLYTLYMNFIRHGHVLDFTVIENIKYVLN
jgi:hypothetical protein